MAAAARTYVDFVPYSYLLDEESDKQTLVVDLSAAGFKKEHLRVQIDNYGRVRISGERPLGGNQWSRFRKETHVPEGYNADDIRARFEDGSLYIIMPRLSPAVEPKAPDAKTGDDASQDQKAADHGSPAQQTAAAEAEQEKKRQEEEGARKRPDQEEEERKSEDEGGRGQGDSGLVTDRRKKMWILLAVALALLVGVGLYAKYRLMDPSAELAPAEDHIAGISDY